MGQNYMWELCLNLDVCKFKQVFGVLDVTVVVPFHNSNLTRRLMITFRLENRKMVRVYYIACGLVLNGLCGFGKIR